MSMEKQEQKEVADTIENVLLQFKEAIKSQEQQNVQTNRRISQFIRYGTFIVLLFLITVVLLFWLPKNDIGSLGDDYMEEMAKDASAMSNAIVQIQTSMKTMEEGINKVVNHTQSMSSAFAQADKSVAVLSNIAGSVKLMQSDARGLNKSIENVNYNLGTINNQMRKLNGKLGAMVQDVNRMSSSSRMFPF